MNIIMGKLVDYEGAANTLTGFGFNEVWDITTNDLLINMLRNHENKETILNQSYNYIDENIIEEVQEVLKEHNIILEGDVI